MVGVDIQERIRRLNLGHWSPLAARPTAACAEGHSEETSDVCKHTPSPRSDAPTVDAPKQAKKNSKSVSELPLDAEKLSNVSKQPRNPPKNPPQSPDDAPPDAAPVGGKLPSSDSVVPLPSAKLLVKHYRRQVTEEVTLSELKKSKTAAPNHWRPSACVGLHTGNHNGKSGAAQSPNPHSGRTTNTILGPVLNDQHGTASTAPQLPSLITSKDVKAIDFGSSCAPSLPPIFALSTPIPSPAPKDIRSVTGDEETTIQKRMRILYLANMQITIEDLQTWIVPHLSLYSYSFGQLLQKAKKLQAQLQRQIWGTPGIRQLVVDAVKTYEREKEKSQPGFGQLTSLRRNQVFVQYFTEGFARRLLEPLKGVVDLEAYLKTERGMRFMQMMFLSACGTIYETSGYGRIMTEECANVNVLVLYANIRAAARTLVPDRLKPDEIPLV